MRDKRFWMLISFINYLFITSVNIAQTPSELLIEDVLEEISVNGGDLFTGLEDEWEELSTALSHPLNLNTATRGQLEALPFLTDRQIESLLAYLHVNGPMQTLHELALVKGMDRATIGRISPFLCVLPAAGRYSPFRLKSLLKQGSHECLARVDIPLYLREGYRDSYRGQPVYNSVKYVFNCGEQLQAGVAMEKDAGEAFDFGKYRKGYDHYSFYLLLKGRCRLKALALGNYRLGFGQGLTLNNGFLAGKTAVPLFFRSGGIRKHSSTDEYNYFSGAAATVSAGRGWEMSAFYSYRLMDGRVEDGKVTSIYTSGLHRTQGEEKKKHLYTIQLTGGHLSYQQGLLKLGATGTYYVFSLPYEPEREGYTRFREHGSRFYNLGLDYQFRYRGWQLEGEAAKGKQGYAVINKLWYEPVNNCRFLLLHRYYSYDYWNLFARSFSEGGRVQNESGWYVSADCSPWAGWHFLAAADWFRFPWWKYRISRPSQGVEVTGQADYSPRAGLTLSAKYGYEKKDRDVAGTSGQDICPTRWHKVRLRLLYAPTDRFSGRTVADGVYFRQQGVPAQRGWMLTQRLDYNIKAWPLRFTLQGQYFRTDGYDARLYGTERGLLYTFYTPSFSGEGFRASLWLRCDVNKHWMLIVKGGETVYLDRETIGQGNDLIHGNRKADVQVQLRIKF